MSKTKRWYEALSNEAGVLLDSATEEILKKGFETMLQNALVSVEDFYQERYDNDQIGREELEIGQQAVQRVRKAFANLEKNM